VGTGQQNISGVAKAVGITDNYYYNKSGKYMSDKLKLYRIK
jgi:hypothetical protein